MINRISEAGESVEVQSPTPKKRNYKKAVSTKKTEEKTEPTTKKEEVQVKLTVKAVKHPTAEEPKYQTAGSAGCDLCANIMYPKWLEPGKFELIDTGLTVADVPAGYELQVRPRSGLAARYGVTVLNAPGTIDSDYRGPIKVILANFGDAKFEVKRGMRIAQLVLSKVEQIEWEFVDSVEETERGDGGFGSTGV